MELYLRWPPSSLHNAEPVKHWKFQRTEQVHVLSLLRMRDDGKRHQWALFLRA
jgi:hypothetical protein